jgi:hypothetical protein
MSSRVDEEQATMNPGIQDEPITLSCQLFPQISRILVLDLSEVANKHFSQRQLRGNREGDEDKSFRDVRIEQ